MKDLAIRHPVLAAAALSVLLLLAVGLFWAFGFDAVIRRPVALAFSAADSSVAMRKALGEPMHVGRFASGRVARKDSVKDADLKISISGPLGHGTLTEWAEKANAPWQVCALVFRSSDGNTMIPIVIPNQTHCSRR